MQLYYEEESCKLYLGDMLDTKKIIKNNSIDSIITDPPYELNFMNKGWDNSGIAFNKDTWKQCYDVLKEGGYLLAFGGTRTYHRIACAIEDAGFEIKDCIMWLYGSGFPKSNNIGLAIDKKMGVQGQKGVGGFNVGGKGEQNNRKAKLYIGSNTDGSKQKTYNDYKSEEAQQWQGWGSALKPAYEPIIMARKRFKGSLTDNVLKNGVGGLNIDACRVETDINDKYDIRHYTNEDCFQNKEPKKSKFQVIKKNELGRFPANIVHDGSDEVISDMLNGASRYFYSAKASKKDRDEGLDTFEEKSIYVNNDQQYGYKNTDNDNLGDRIKNVKRKNFHPTVKPATLMQYLVRLVTPKGGTILDPFMGSGSTGKAIMFENNERNADYKFIGIEMTKDYLPLCKQRIEYALKNNSKTVIEKFR